MFTKKFLLTLCIIMGSGFQAKAFFGGEHFVSQEETIHKILENGHSNIIEIIETFVEQGGNTNVADEEGRTLLYKAIEKGDEDLARYLVVEAGVDVNIREDLNGDTALHLSAKNDNSDMVRLLLIHGADPRIINYWGDTAFDMAMVNENRLNVQLIFDKLVRISLRDIRKKELKYLDGILEFF